MINAPQESWGKNAPTKNDDRWKLWYHKIRYKRYR